MTTVYHPHWSSGYADDPLAVAEQQCRRCRTDRAVASALRLQQTDSQMGDDLLAEIEAIASGFGQSSSDLVLLLLAEVRRLRSMREEANDGPD